MPRQEGLTKHSEFGLAGIFDNVRDGLALVRFPERKIVLFNTAASEMSGVPVPRALGASLDSLFADPVLHARIRRCSTMPVGVWPGHFQDALQTQFKGRPDADQGIEVHICRVDPSAFAGPLVLLVMRASVESQLEAAVTKYSRRLDTIKAKRGVRPRRAARPVARHRKVAKAT